MASYVQTLMDPISTGPETPAGVKSSRDWAAYLLKGSQEPVAHWAQGIGNIVKALQGGYTEYKAAETEKEGQRKSTEALLAALGLNAPSTTPNMPASTPQTPTNTMPQFAPPPNMNPMFADTPIMSVSDAPTQRPTTANADPLVARILRNESGGNPDAVNPRSSAAGAGQFINSTWLSMIKSQRPDLAAGKTDAELLALRNNPELSAAMTRAYADQNTNSLQTAGNQPTPGNIYLAHFVGPAGANAILRADPNAPVAGILGPQVIQANPFLSNMTAGQMRQWADSKMNGVQSIAPSAPPSAANASAGVVPSSPAATPPINRQALAQVLLNPWAPDSVKGAVLQQLLPKQPLTVKEGETLLDPRTFQPIYQNQKNENQWKEIGKDDYGNPRYGWVNPRSKGVDEQNVPRPVNPAAANTPPQQASQPNEITDPNNPNYPHIRPAPAGANTKDWYEAETKRVAAARNMRPQVVQAATGVIQDIDRIIGMVKEAPGKTTGTGAQLLSNIGGSKAKDVSALLDTIKANASFDKLQAMRAASPTGGALGQVSDNENRMLQSAIAALDQSQSADQFTRNLNRVKNVYLDIVHGPGNGPARIPIDAQQGPQGAPQPAPQVGQVINGFRYKGGNPNDENSYEKVQ